jgi:hypothetical protein
MKVFSVKLALALAITGALAIGLVAVAVAKDGKKVDSPKKIDSTLSSFQEVPALATPGHGEFRAQIDDKAGEIRWQLTFGDLESDATQSHIHFENSTNSGPVVVFLCTNLGNSPVPVQACPADGGTISGTIKAADVIGVAGGAAVGIDTGDFADLVRAIRAGAAYVNVHSTTRPAGEVRAQLGGKQDGPGKDG